MADEKKRRTRRQFGAVRKLPSGRWQASYDGPDGRRRPAGSTFPTKADASSWLSTIETGIIRGEWRPPEPSRETFGAYGKRWLKLGMSRHGKPLSPTTQELYEILWRLWLEPTFGNVALGDMTPESWRTWFAEASADHPGSTQPGKAYRLARAILNTAVEDDKIRVNPCQVKGAGKEQAAERPIASPAEVLAIAEAIGAEYRPLILMAAWCSLRFGELAGLRRDRVDILHRTVLITEQAVELAGGKVVFKEPKAGSARKVAVPAELVAILETHLSENVGPQPAALVFTSPEGHPLRRTKFRPRWTDACAKAGVSDLHLHDLRGSGATWAATTGATVAELMNRLGHRTPTVAMRYQHATEERDQAIAGRLGALMAKPAEEESSQAVVPIRA
jgi:integrase